MSQEIQNKQQEEIIRTEVPADVIEKLVLYGDLSGMQPQEKVTYYNGICTSLGLNPLTQPFAITKLNGKEVMYAKKDATEQLRRIYGVSVTGLEKEQIGDIYMITAKGVNRAGRTDSAIGAVSLTGKTGEALANQIMKAETKAKRRLTLSICGLGMLDETEVESVKGIQVDQEKHPDNNTISLDVLDPSNPEVSKKFEEMMNAISFDVVPVDAFGPGTDKNAFITEFKSQFESGTMPVEYGDKVYNFVVTFFPKQ